MLNDNSKHNCALDLRKIKHIYALDNGNGNIMAYRIDMKVNNPTMEPIVDEKGEPAGYTLSADGKMQLGKQLIDTDFPNFSKATVFPVNFKAIPTDENRVDMITYLKGWLQRIKRKCPSIEADGQDALWMIGCPNGWDEEAIQAYKELFIEAGYVNPIIVKESNAAMKHLIKSNEKYNVYLKKGIMCIDSGAYSNDGTFVLPKKVKSKGNFVGASLIEKMIVMANLQKADTYRKAKKPHNPEELTQMVYQEMMTNEVFESFLILQARWLKELYFDEKAKGTLSNRDITTSFNIDKENSFKFFINIEMMNDLISKQSIKSVLGEALFLDLPQEVQNEIQDKTWKECFCDFLECLAAEFPSFKQQAMNENKEKALVLVTGGASKMDVIEECINIVYPNVIIKKDDEPILTIAKGLIEFAPDKINSMLLEQAFNESLNQKTSYNKDELLLLSVIKESYLKIYQPLIEVITKNFEDSVNMAISKWLEYDCTSDQIGKLAYQKFASSIEEYMKDTFDKKCEEENKIFIERMNKEIQTLLSNTQLEGIKIFTEGCIDLEFNKKFKNEFPNTVKTTISLYCEALQRNHFSYLANSDFFNIFIRRKAIYQASTVRTEVKSYCKKLEKILMLVFLDGSYIECYMEDMKKILFEKVNHIKDKIIGDLFVEEDE